MIFGWPLRRGGDRNVSVAKSCQAMRRKANASGIASASSIGFSFLVIFIINLGTG